MKKYILKIITVVLNIIYLPFRMTKTDKKIFFLSRQSNSISIDMRMLIDQVHNENNSIKLVSLSRKIGDTIKDKCIYCISIFCQMYHIATSKVVVIDGYNPLISILKHNSKLRVVQVWHALGAIKKFGYQVIDKEEGHSKIVADIFKMHKNYDLICCASDATKSFFKEAFDSNGNNIEILGMPRVDYIKNITVEKDVFYTRFPQFKNKTIILYVPTFRKDTGTDFSEISSYNFDDNQALIIKKHPLDAGIVPNEFVIDDNYDTYELMKIADYIITDYSALGIEATLVNKPIFFYLYDYEQYVGNRGLNINLKIEMQDAVFSKFEDIMSSIKSNKYNYEQIEAFKNKYIMTDSFNNTEAIVAKLMEYIREDFFA